MDQSSQKLRRDKWFELVKEQETSGLSQKVFCEQRNLVLSQFVYYRSCLKAREVKHVNAKPSFQPVKLTKHKQENQPDIHLTLPNRFKCTFPECIDPNQLKLLVGALLSC